MKLRLAHNDEKKQPDWFLGKLSEVYNNGKIIVSNIIIKIQTAYKYFIITDHYKDGQLIIYCCFAFLK